jgi:hypothetical protein
MLSFQNTIDTELGRQSKKKRYKPIMCGITSLEGEQSKED